MHVHACSGTHGKGVPDMLAHPHSKVLWKEKENTCQNYTLAGEHTAQLAFAATDSPPLTLITTMSSASLEASSQSCELYLVTTCTSICRERRGRGRVQSLTQTKVRYIAPWPPLQPPNFADKSKVPHMGADFFFTEVGMLRKV